MRHSLSNYAAFSCTLALTLVGFAPAAQGKSHKSKGYPQDLTFPVPQFSIAIKLSDSARQKLESMHESVLVIAYFDGDPLPGQGQDNAPFRDVFLGSDEKLVDSQSTATFDATKISQSNWNKLADKNYFVTINVFSARKASKNNILSCGLREDHLSTFAGKTTEISCDLIGSENSIANSALKSLGGTSK